MAWVVVSVIKVSRGRWCAAGRRCVRWWGIHQSHQSIDQHHGLVQNHPVRAWRWAVCHSHAQPPCVGANGMKAVWGAVQSGEGGVCCGAVSGGRQAWGRWGGGGEQVRRQHGSWQVARQALVRPWGIVLGMAGTAEGFAMRSHRARNGSPARQLV